MSKKKILFILLFVVLCLAFVGILLLQKTNNQKQSNDRKLDEKQVEVITDFINIRENSSTSSNIIGKVFKNEIYDVIEENDLWIKIHTSNNITGWIISSYNNTSYVKFLEVNGQIPDEQEKLDKIAKNEYLDLNSIKYTKLKWKSDIPLADIKCIKDNGMMDIQPKMFITTSGELYEFSTDKIYSNEQVCKKIDTDVTFDRFSLFANDRDLSIIISTDNQYYYYKDGEFQDYFINDNSIRKINEEHPNNYGYYQGGATSYDIYYYIENNNIYEYKIKPYYDPYSQSLKHEFISDGIIDTIQDGEEFVSLDGRIIKTNKAFYKLGIKNQEECNKYEDVEPIFGLVKLDKISEDYNKIKYFNGNYIIYNDDPENLYIYSQHF